jgi:hypothetical protein
MTRITSLLEKIDQRKERRSEAPGRRQEDFELRQGFSIKVGSPVVIEDVLVGAGFMQRPDGVWQFDASAQ